MTRRDSHPPADGKRCSRVRLAGYLGPRALRRTERPLPEKMPGNLFHESVGLVGKNGENDPFCRQAVQQVGDSPGTAHFCSSIFSCIRSAPFRNALPDHAVVNSLGDCPTHEDLEPVSHEIPIAFHRVNGPSLGGKDRVHGVRKILEGVEERPVKIEENCFEAHECWWSIAAAN